MESTSEVVANVSRQDIIDLENAMREFESVEIETRHYFSDGLYAREIFIPKGTLLTGKIHKREHINIVSKGKIAVVTEFGRKVIEAPCTFIAPPGTKRAGLALEDTVWTTVHACECKDAESAEAELIAPSFELLEG